MRNIGDLHPILQEKIKQLKKLCQTNGLKIGISECLRTKAEQDALYAKGRTTKGSIVTNAKGSTYSSMHQWGIAFDFYRNDGKGAYNDSDGFFKKVGSLGKSIGLMWGGDWRNPVDKPHFQLPDWGATASVLKKKYKTPENFMKTWGDTAMTADEKKKFDELTKKVEELSDGLIKVENPMRYGYVDNNMPAWARHTIQKLMDKGILVGDENGKLDLSYDSLTILVINDRAGLYD